MKTKTPKESYAISTHLVLPHETNLLGNLMGGRLLHWMDICAAIAAHRHSQRVVVTASVNHVSFERAIKLGDYV
ncbi:MAG TPA: acyl-CoA thioesterase, partial [Bacteroidia bacterium]|nr:acyl-CoA thioesterase [Bacteroidia bacterium]